MFKSIMSKSNDDIVCISVLIRGEITSAIYRAWEENVHRIPKYQIYLTPEYRNESKYLLIDSKCTVDKFLSWAWAKQKNLPDSSIIVTPQWLIDSIKSRRLLDPKPYHNHIFERQTQSSDGFDSEEDNNSMKVVSQTVKQRPSSPGSMEQVHEIHNIDERIKKQKHSTSEKSQAIERDYNGNRAENKNRHITDVLEGLQSVYEASGDRRRALVYKKAVAELKQRPYISNVEQLNSVPGIGKSIQDKISEILETGRLKKLAYFEDNPKIRVVQQFSNIYGIGPEVAETLYKKGYHSIEELRERGQHELTNQQRIGLLRLDDLVQKMPRNEVEEIDRIVRQHLHRYTA